MFTPNVSGLYAARIISGLGIGALSVTGPMTIAELAPPEIRGLLTAWYSVMQMVALTSSTLTTYGIQLHMAPSRLQYQLALFVPCIFMFLLSIFSFWLPESPRWLMLAGAHDEAVTALLRLRRLPASHPRIQQEIQAIWETIESETELSRNGARSFAGIKAVAKETFTVRSNVYRLQQALILYVLPQLSGGNSVTNYFIPLTKILGIQHNPTHGIFLSGMYALSKLFFTLIASFILIDGLGRRGSLFLGTTMQMICNIYLAAYLKVEQDTGASHAASEAALAFIFINAFGYAVGLLTLPYCFGGELWPDNIRSFGAALAQTCHWLFHFGMTYGLPGLLAATDNWGAFVFFAAWCLIALVYVFFMVPEIANLSVEEMEKVFSRPMFTAYKAGGRKDEIQTLEGADLHDLS
ncbi:putative quinate permease [Pseudocercospora fuligena]|uniref:Putative quinate permease n=1 Tax=Pseudocercospora fuligena TaxID=685502 RepID=A0A8H6RGK8_9PEZI|nr:putative quinate permease [Pseudocercospora fuligena]